MSLINKSFLYLVSGSAALNFALLPLISNFVYKNSSFLIKKAYAITLDQNSDIRQEDRQLGRREDRQLGRQEDRQLGRREDRQLGRQEDRQLGRREDRQFSRGQFRRGESNRGQFHRGESL